MVDGDSIGDPNLIGTGVALSDGGCSPVHDGTQARSCERGCNGLRLLDEFGFLQQGEDRCLYRGHDRCEAEERPFLISFPHRKAVLKHAVDDAPHAKGRLDD